MKYPNITKIIVALIVLFITLRFTWCREYPEPEKVACSSTSRTVVLVAYKVAKHSHMWLKDVRTSIVWDISGLGGRREPVMNLGDTIVVQFCGDELLDTYKYVKEPVDRTSRYVSL